MGKAKDFERLRNLRGESLPESRYTHRVFSNCRLRCVGRRPPAAG